MSRTETCLNPDSAMHYLCDLGLVLFKKKKDLFLYLKEKEWGRGGLGRGRGKGRGRWGD